MPVYLIRCCIVILLMSYISIGKQQSGWSSLIFPEAHFDGDCRTFFNRKNQQFRERYVCEWNMNTDLTFYAFNEQFFWVFRGELTVDMGESEVGLLLNPYDIELGIIPALEYRHSNVHFSMGLDHRCFHGIDHLPELGIIYWNKIVFRANSSIWRKYPCAIEVLNRNNTIYQRLQWSIAWGYYISDFFNVIAPYKLMSIDRPHYVHDGIISAKYPLLSMGSWGILGSEKVMLGFKKKGAVYWAQELGIEFLWNRKNFDVSLFSCFTLDGGRFDSKDQLFEIGISVAK